jgi:DNA-binding CsgD family transcriptional regulator
LFVRKAAPETPSQPELIAKTYKLTPTELRVLLAIVEIGGVREVAATLGIARTTVKTHLGPLFDKTGASRQADLARPVLQARSWVDFLTFTRHSANISSGLLRSQDAAALQWQLWSRLAGRMSGGCEVIKDTRVPSCINNRCPKCLSFSRPPRAR